MGRSAGDDSGRSVFGGPPPVGGSRDSCGSGPEDWLSSGSGGLGGTVGGSGDGLQGGRAEFAQRVEAAPGELAGDRQRRARVREPARLECEVVGAVGAGGAAGRLGRFVEPPAQLRRALAGQLAGARAAGGGGGASVGGRGAP